MSAWDDLVTAYGGGLNLEKIPVGTILKEDFLNAFVEAMNERMYNANPAFTDLDTFTKGEIMDEDFFDKLNDLVDAYKALYTNYTWIESALFADPTLDEPTYTIGTSEIQTILNHPTSSAYDTIIVKTKAQRTWSMLLKAEVWTGMYLMLKNLRYIKQTIGTKTAGTNGTLGIPYAITNSGLATLSDVTESDSNTGDFIDYSALETTFASEWATYRQESNMMAWNTDELRQLFTFVRGDVNQEFIDPDWGVVDDYGQLDAAIVLPRDVEILCKRKSDDAILTTSFKTVFNVNTNNSAVANIATWENDTPDSGTSVNVNTNTTYDVAFPVSGGKYNVTSAIAQGANGTKQTYRDPAIPYSSPDVLGISLYPRASFETDASFGGGVSGTTYQSIGKTNDLKLTRASYAYIDLNNSALDYYIT